METKSSLNFILNGDQIGLDLQIQLKRLNRPLYNPYTEKKQALCQVEAMCI